VQIDLELVENNREMVEDLLDVLLIRSRANEPTIPLEEVERKICKAKDR